MAGSTSSSAEPVPGEQAMARLRVDAHQLERSRGLAGRLQPRRAGARPRPARRARLAAGARAGYRGERAPRRRALGAARPTRFRRRATGGSGPSSTRRPPAAARRWCCASTASRRSPRSTSTASGSWRASRCSPPHAVEVGDRLGARATSSSSAAARSRRALATPPRAARALAHEARRRGQPALLPHDAARARARVRARPGRRSGPGGRSARAPPRRRRRGAARCGRASSGGDGVLAVGARLRPRRRPDRAGVELTRRRAACSRRPLTRHSGDGLGVVARGELRVPEVGALVAAHARDAGALRGRARVARGGRPRRRRPGRVPRARAGPGRPRRSSATASTCSVNGVARSSAAARSGRRPTSVSLAADAGRAARARSSGCATPA